MTVVEFLEAQQRDTEFSGNSGYERLQKGPHKGWDQRAWRDGANKFNKKTLRAHPLGSSLPCPLRSAFL